MKLTIGHLYPQLLNLYGDRGNIICMVQRLQWRGIEAEVKEFDLNDEIDFSELDIVLLGGGSDREQLLVCNRLRTIKEDFLHYVECGGVVLAICGGYQLLGTSYKMGDETIEGLGVVQIHTERGDERLVGNIVLQSDLFPLPIVGFENHGGRTFIGNYEPLGKVLSGHGNHDNAVNEGIQYKHVIGTYLHGPLLPKNPHLCDYLLQLALNRRYGQVELMPLDDQDELKANHYIVEHFTRTDL